MIICDDCGRTFQTTDAVLMHECRPAGVKAQPAPLLPKPNRCTHCRRDFKSQRALAVHMHRMHTKAEAEA